MPIGLSATAGEVGPAASDGPDATRELPGPTAGVRGSATHHLGLRTTIPHTP
jgi:hypothetical protein